MSKETKTSAVLSFMDTHWTDHPAVEWISNNKQTLLWIVLGLFAALILSYRFLMNRNINAEANFFRAQAEFVKFQDTNDAGSLSTLESIMKDHPELHQKYDGALAQTLLVEKQVTQAETFAQATFKRTANDSITLYHDYAATSLLIGNKNYQEALNHAQTLNAKLLEGTEKPQGTLYLFNLIRLGLLNQELGLAKEEKQIWGNLTNSLQQSDSDEVIHLFRIGQATLNEFIAERMQALERV